MNGPIDHPGVLWCRPSPHDKVHRSPDNWFICAQLHGPRLPLRLGQEGAARWAYCGKFWTSKTREKCDQLTLEGLGGGGILGDIFVAIFSAPWAFMPFFFEVLLKFRCCFRKNQAYYLTLCNQTAQTLNIFWICVQNMENGFWCPSSILSSKVHYILDALWGGGAESAPSPVLVLVKNIQALVGL